MPSGNQHQFYISEDSVRAALDAMLYTSTLRAPSPLESLLLVDQFLSKPDIPLVEHERTFAIQHILTSIITSEFERQRYTLGLICPNRDEIMDAAILSIQLDGQTSNPELLGWSVLYYRYIRVDLNLSPSVISSAMGIEDRTFRRYQIHAMRRLAQHLSHAEWETRRHQAQLRLYASLPIMTHNALTGREKHIRQVQQSLLQSLPFHIQITGAAGIGKTVFVREIVEQHIINEEVDQLVWITSPPSPNYVRHYLTELLWPDDVKLSLKQYSLEHRLVVVLDDIEWTVDEQLEMLLEDLSGAYVYLTSRVHLPFARNLKHLTLRELPENDAVALAQKFMLQDIDSELAQDYGLQVWQMVGGNPLAIQLVARSLQIYDTATIHTGVLNTLFDRTYNSLDNNHRRAWLLFTLFPAKPVQIMHLLEIWQGQIQQSDISTLLQHGLIEFAADSQSGFLTTSCHRYLQQHCEQSPEAQALVADLLERLDLHIDPRDDFIFDLVEHILFTGWPVLSQRKFQDLVVQFASEGIRREHYSQWLAIIERNMQDNTESNVYLLITQAICLRHLSDWPQAEQKFRQAVYDAGSLGMFIEQGRALAEWGVIFQMRGQFEQAVEALKKAHAIAVRYSDADLQNLVRLEQAQLAVDAGNAASIDKLLDGVPQSTRTLALRAEGRLLTHHLHEGFDLVQNAIAGAGNNPKVRAKLYILASRMYEHQNDLDNAYHYLSQAVNLLDHEHDFAALARAQCNLGSILIQKKRYQEAYDLLTRAEGTQVWLGDRVALAATRHNLNILRRQFAG